MFCLLKGKYASYIEKAAFLVHLQYVHQAEAARRVGIHKSIAADIKAKVVLDVEHVEKGLPPPT